MAASLDDTSILRPLGYHKSLKCGYCKTQLGNSSYFLKCDRMRVDHYQILVDRGWRRAGEQYYKPDLTRSCCPHYTIRLDAKNFTSRKGQRKSMNRWNRYVLGIEYLRKVAALCPQSRDEKRQKRDVFDLREVVHKSEYPLIPRPISRRTQKPIEPAHRFEVNLESDSFTEEKYGMFIKYQEKIHKEKESEWGHNRFENFLCNGVGQKTLKFNGKMQKLGSFHQCYRLDGKLIAVGVLDLLPHAVSSVYLFYDPEYEEWELGKTSALQEISLALEGGYGYYYMGFYIHSCKKMRYKATFSPSYILDPESLSWNLFDEEMHQNLDTHSYFSPSAHRGDRTETAAQSVRQSIKLASMPENGDGSKSGHANDKKSKDSCSNSTTNDPDFEIDSDSEHSDTEALDASLFEYNIPGVLSKAEVEKLDLGHWKIFVRKNLIDFEDLRDWDNWRIDDPQSIKGWVAELAAAIGGGKLLENSAVQLF